MNQIIYLLNKKVHYETTISLNSAEEITKSMNNISEKVQIINDMHFKLMHLLYM